MKKTNFTLSILLASILVITQVSVAFAVPASEDSGSILSGTVQEITLRTDPATAVTTVLVSILDQLGEKHRVRLSQEKAVELDLVTLDDDGNPVIIHEALGTNIQIDPSDVLPDEEAMQHPVGSALATFFSDIPGLNYETLMSAYKAGNGFGVIAQTLWLTRKLEGDSEVFITILKAKQSGDFSDITLEDGTSPLNWGQFRKAVLEKKENPGIVISTNNPDQEIGSNGNNGNSSNSNNRDNDQNNRDKNRDKNKDNKGNGNPNKP